MPEFVVEELRAQAEDLKGGEKITIRALMALSLVAYFALVTTVVGFGVTARYRAPVNLFILAFAFYAGAKWFGFDINKNRSSYQPDANRQ